MKETYSLVIGPTTITVTYDSREATVLVNGIELDRRKSEEALHDLWSMGNVAFKIIKRL